MKILYTNNVPVQKFESIGIELSFDEATALLAVLRKVGGDPKDSRRKHIDPICRALYPHFNNPHRAAKDLTGGVSFNSRTSNEKGS